MRSAAFAAIAALALGACKRQAGEEISLGDPVLAELSARDVAVVERYLRSSPRWEVSERRGMRYAIRREKPAPSKFEPAEGVTPRDPEFDLPGGYVGGHNGFHSDFDSKDVVQTRVLIGLGSEHGFGSRGVTRARADGGTARVSVDTYMSQPGLESYLIVEGAQGVTLEVFEQSHVRARKFTERAVREVTVELRAALAARETLMKQGYVAELLADAPLKRGRPRMRIQDGMQPGIYTVTAWVNPGENGRVFLRVFFEGPDPAVGKKGVPQEITAVGEELSPDRIRPGTLRLIGWSPKADVLFHYQAGLTVYEGGWGDAYRARFELWLDPLTGPPRKLLEASRTIAGWER